MGRDEMAAYLAHDTVVDWQDEGVRQQAAALRAATPIDTARRCDGRLRCSSCYHCCLARLQRRMRDGTA